MLEQFTDKEKQRFIIALLIGAVMGFGANYSTHAFVKNSSSPLAELRSSIKYSTIAEIPKRCTVKANEVRLLSEPSSISGQKLRMVSKGLQVDYLETVESLDKEATQAIAAYDLQFKPLFHRTVYIPKGTVFSILEVDGNEYKCSFTINDKTYTKRFEKQLLLVAYTGSWYKVKIDDTTGFLQIDQATEPKYL